MAADDAQLRVERCPGGIVLTGEIDAHTAARLRGALIPTLDSGDLRVDLSGVTFIDSSGLRVVLEAHQRFHGDGCRLVLVAPSKPVARLIEVAGLVSHLHVEPPLDSAGSTRRIPGADL